MSRTSKTALVQSLHNSPESIKPMNRQKLPQEEFHQPLENAGYKRKLDLLRGQSTGSQRRTQVQDSRSPRQQLFLMSSYVLHEQLFQDGLWHHVQENCFRVFQGSMRDLKSCRYTVALVKFTSLLLYLPMCTFRSTQHLHSWATAPQAAVCTIDGKYTSSTLLLA